MTNSGRYKEAGWMVRVMTPDAELGQPVSMFYYAAAPTREAAEAAVKARHGARPDEEVASTAMVAAERMVALKMAHGQVAPI